MKSLYANGAVSKLTAPISATDLAVSVDNGALFPSPVDGQEIFWMTLVGNVSQATEIVKVTSKNGDIMNVVRGQNGSIAKAFNVGDQAYHALTAEDAESFRDAMRYYLGAHPTDPAVGNSGEPLEAGMLYYNITASMMREYDGASWDQFGVIVNIAGVVENMWGAHAAVSAGDYIAWPDDSAKAAPDYDVANQVSVYINGEKLLNSDSVTSNAGYTVDDDAGTMRIQLLDAQASAFRLEVTVSTDESAASNAITGYKNLIINGRLGTPPNLVIPDWIINQRGFDGNWDSVIDGEFGYDRWERQGATMVQHVEFANIISGESYTLSWDGGGTVYITLGGSFVSLESSPITLIAGSDNVPFNTRVVMPNDASNIQLELGTVPTSFEIRPVGLELSLCKRYANNIGDGFFIASGYALNSTTAIILISFITMRSSPLLNHGLLDITRFAIEDITQNEIAISAINMRSTSAAAVTLEVTTSGLVAGQPVFLKALYPSIEKMVLEAEIT